MESNKIKELSDELDDTLSDLTYSNLIKVLRFFMKEQYIEMNDIYNEDELMEYCIDNLTTQNNEPPFCYSVIDKIKYEIVKKHLYKFSPDELEERLK